MVNDNWFMKGNSSQKFHCMYSQLQSKYLSYTASLENQSQDTWGVILDPNQNGSNIFDKFHFSLLAMNGTHGLRPHNENTILILSSQNLFQSIMMEMLILLILKTTFGK